MRRIVSEMVEMVGLLGDVLEEWGQRLQQWCADSPHR